MFVKLDISKAFDTVNWPYLLSVMTHLGFGHRWRNWISSLWCMASSSFLLNEEPDRRILHCRGVRQGDPLSPMLFLLAMEPLHQLFARAQQEGLIQKLSNGCDTFRMSLYADDAAVFVNPSTGDLQITDCILEIFANASGLVTNMQKTEYYPIRCDGMNMDFLTHNGQSCSNFPCTYLGLPLHIRKPSGTTMQPLVQKIADRLHGWKRDFMTYPRRELLVKTVLTAMPTYFMTVFKLSKWEIMQIDRYRRSFLWKGTDPDNVRGEHCLVN